jgi:hypothetical protein
MGVSGEVGDVGGEVGDVGGEVGNAACNVKYGTRSSQGRTAGAASKGLKQWQRSSGGELFVSCTNRGNWAKQWIAVGCMVWGHGLSRS